MMARMLSQLPLPLLPAGAAEIAPCIGVLAGEDGGLVTVHGLAAVQLVRLRAASQGQVAEAFGVDPATIWRWDQALAAGGVAGLVPSRRGPKGASKLTPELGADHRAGRGEGDAVADRGGDRGVHVQRAQRAGPGRGRHAGRDPRRRRGRPVTRDDDAGQGAVPVLPDPVSRDGERALARWGLLGEGADPVFTPGARYPLAGLLLALPALEGTGLLEAAREVYGRLRDGSCGLTATLLTVVFLALAGEPRAVGATGSRRRRWAGCSVWTGRRRSRRSTASWASSPRPARQPG